MRLLLLGAALDEGMLSSLKSVGLEAQVDAQSKDAPLIVAVNFPHPSALHSVREARERYPRSWLAVILPPGFESDAALTESMRELGALGVNELWRKESWIQTLTFSVECAKHFAIHSLATEMLVSTQEAVTRLEKNVALASAIHRQMLPISFPSFPGIHLSAKFIPASGNGGNYFDVFELGDGRSLGILLADSQTHALAASLLSALLKLGADEIRTQFPQPALLIQHLVEESTAKQSNSEALQILYAVLDRTDLSLEVAVHGQLGLWRWRDKEVEAWLPDQKQPGTKTFKKELKPKDWLIFLTDGWFTLLDHAPAPAMSKLLTSFTGPDPVSFQQELLGIVDRWREQDDLPEDLTCVQLHIDARTLFVAK